VNVSAIIVTRGDVDLEPVLDSLPWEWEIVVWDNSYGYVKRQPPGGRDWNTWTHLGRGNPPADLSVYGRYAAIEYASHDLIYVQDDDVIVSDPEAIAQAHREAEPHAPVPFLTANMPRQFRHGGYEDSCLVGFGACFHRDLPGLAFRRFAGGVSLWEMAKAPADVFKRTCDVVFTTLTPFRLVDIDKQDREFASDDNRMWRQKTHLPERTRMLELARQVRDS
jgi:hypothetical protein